ncbi:MAG: hypothetical protein FWD06_04620 [Oscillospiraceae bacterium]|nr:hypothetical protein [Oscillospiraceae bacterium]
MIERLLFVNEENTHEAHTGKFIGDFAAAGQFWHGGSSCTKLPLHMAAA